MWSRPVRSTACDSDFNEQSPFKLELSDLPVDVIHEILSKLKVHDLASFMRTSKRNYTLSKHMTIWRSFAGRDFRSTLTLDSMPCDAYRALNKAFELEKYKLLGAGSLSNACFLDDEETKSHVYLGHILSSRVVSNFLKIVNLDDGLLDTCGEISPAKIKDATMRICYSYRQITHVLTDDEFVKLRRKSHVESGALDHLNLSKQFFEKQMTAFISGRLKPDYKECSFICYDQMISGSLSPLFENLIDFSKHDLPDKLTQFHYHYELFEMIMALHLDIHLRIAIHQYPESLKHLPLLHMACKHGYLYGIKLLLEHGAEVNRRSWLYEYHSLGSSPIVPCTTPLSQCIYALLTPHILVGGVTMLLLCGSMQEHGIDLLQLGNNAILCVNYLLQHGADVDIEDLRFGHYNVECANPLSPRNLAISCLSEKSVDPDFSDLSDSYIAYSNLVVACAALIKDAPRLSKPVYDAASAAMTL